MTDAVRVVAGPLTGRVFPVIKPVIRIGRSRQCDIALEIEGINEHAVTLQVENHVYRLYNRSRKPLRLDDHEIRPGASATWPYDANLVLSDQCALRLEDQGSLGSDQERPARDVADGPVSRPLPTEESATSVDRTERSKASDPDRPKSNALQIGVIVAAVIASIAILWFREDSPEATSADALAPTSLLESIQKRLKENEGQKRPEPELRSIFDELRSGYLQECSGNPEKAVERYDQILSRLKSHLSRNATGLSAVEPKKQGASEQATKGAASDLTAYFSDPLDRQIFIFATRHRKMAQMKSH